MALTPAERARRSRRHKAGDHRLCDPSRCYKAVTPLTPTTPTQESRGQRLFRELKPGLTPGQLVLAEEAARIVDRLDRMDRILNGDTQEWLHFRTVDDDEVRVVVNSVLSESRQQATALKGLLAELRQSGARAAGPASVPAAGTVGGIADLSARIAARRKPTPS